MTRKFNWDDILPPILAKKLVTHLRNQSFTWNKQTFPQTLEMQVSDQLVLYTDSSGDGISWLLADGKRVLFSEAKPFNSDIQKWNCHRQEVLGILKGL